MCLRRMLETWLDLTHWMCSVSWYIATSLIHITGNWTSKPTESRKEHTWHGEEWTNLGAPWHRSCTTFLRRQLFYPEGFVVWSPSRGLHKCTLFPFTLLESLGWCRSRCHVDLLFNFAGMFFVWVLQYFWHGSILIGNSLAFSNVYLLSRQSYRVASVCHSRRDSLDSCVNSWIVE